MTADVIFLHDRKCPHTKGFLYDESLEAVACRTCNERLNPMWVIRHLARKESALRHRYDELAAQVRSLDAQLRFKCDHCSKYTRLKK